MRLGLGLTPGQSYIVIWLSRRGFKFQIWLTSSMLLKSAYGQQHSWGQKVLWVPTSRRCSCADITTKQQTNNFTDRHFHGSTTAESPWSLSKKKNLFKHECRSSVRAPTKCRVLKCLKCYVPAMTWRRSRSYFVAWTWRQLCVQKKRTN